MDCTRLVCVVDGAPPLPLQLGYITSNCTREKIEHKIYTCMATHSCYLFRNLKYGEKVLTASLTGLDNTSYTENQPTKIFTLQILLVC